MTESNLVNSVGSDDIDIEHATPRWFIDLDWHQQSNRSFFALAKSCLCPQCNQRLRTENQEITAVDLVSAVKDCCCRVPGFITPQLPILESVFRLFLANGNQPLDLEELGQQLREWRGGDSYRTSPEILTRLLINDQHYGLRQVQA